MAAEDTVVAQGTVGAEDTRVAGHLADNGTEVVVGAPAEPGVDVRPEVWVGNSHRLPTSLPESSELV